MNMSGIIKDSLRYPFSDWKNIIILGIIPLSIFGTAIFFNQKSILIFIVLIGFLLSIFIEGYLYRIIKSSLNGMDKLPKFNAWTGMFTDGVKVFIVHFVYLIPILILLSIFTSNLFTYLDIINSSSITLFLTYSIEIIRAIIDGKIFAFDPQVWNPILVIIIYLFISIPILYMGLANMAKNNSKLITAFSFQEIFYKITIIGLKKLIIWYIALLIPFAILLPIHQTIHIRNIYQFPLYAILTLTIYPYFYMYFNRLIALFYKSE